MTPDLSNVRTTLTAMRLNLVHQLAELGSNENGELETELQFRDAFADAASATAERTEVLGLVENLKIQLNDVDAALAKVEAGSYGTCSNCGKEIPSARLEARPESVLCVECKSRR